MSLPAETGPHLAPDRLSVWPMEDGRFGSMPPTTERPALGERKHSDSASRQPTSAHPFGKSLVTTGRCASGH